VYRLHLPPVPPATLRWQRMEPGPLFETPRKKMLLEIFTPQGHVDHHSRRMGLPGCWDLANLCSMCGDGQDGILLILCIRSPMIAQLFYASAPSHNVHSRAKKNRVTLPKYVHCCLLFVAHAPLCCAPDLSY